MRRGFTLIELMVVVAIIGLLASMAAPSLAGALERARRAEVTLVKGSLSRALQDAFLRNNSRWPTDPYNYQWNPYIDLSTLSTVPGECTVGPPQKWDTVRADEQVWKFLEFEPEGLLRARYYVSSGGQIGLPFTPDYQVVSASDLDNDGICAGHLTSWALSPTGLWPITLELSYGVDAVPTIDGEW